MGMGERTGNYRLWLAEELAERTRRNPAYSLAAFSKSLGLSAPTLSQVLSGKRPLSRKAALKIVSRCGFSPDESNSFLSSILLTGPEVAASSKAPVEDFTELEIDTFKVI